MKLKNEFMTHMDGENQMMVDVSLNFSGLVRSNKTAAEIVELLKFDTTEENIVSEMQKKYDVSEYVLKKDVRRIIEILRSIGAIDE
ncbi:MAG: PqqD family protein [Ruminococcus sp.]|nr:PqqD family protein [Ruminococcus sp.]MDE6848301.1 PqqD family protein [Ruminococcus sp.]MDE7138789.1 PqqD family protein [Ruminococcus sp.]